MNLEAMKKLQQIKGIGKVLAQRLVEAGIVNYKQVLQAGEEGLGAIAGLQPRMIPSILAQAATLAGEAEGEAGTATADEQESATATAAPAKSKRQHKLDGLQKVSNQLQGRVRDLVAEVMDKKEGLAKKATGKRLQKEADKLLKSLAKVEARMDGRLKRAKKGLTRAEERLESLVGLGPNKLARGMKKARRPLKRVIG